MEYTPSPAVIAFFQRYPNAAPIYEIADGSKRWLTGYEVQAINYAREQNKLLFKVTSALVVTQYYPTPTAMQGGSYYDA